MNLGDLTSRGADAFAWDAEDRMSSATVAGTATTFAYNGDGLRQSPASRPTPRLGCSTRSASLRACLRARYYDPATGRFLGRDEGSQTARG